MSTFDERAREWDTEDRVARARAVAAAIRSVVPMSRTTRAIEIGAGTGLLGLQLASELGELVLTDTSTGMLEMADEKIQRGGLRNVRTARYDLLVDPPPAPGRFDLVLSLLMLHHVEDTAGVLQAGHDLLASGGRIAIADLDQEDGSFHGPEAEGIHHHGFGRHTLAELAVAAGFEDVQMRTATEIVRDGRRYRLFLLTARRAIERG